MISNDCATNTFETKNFWPIKSQSSLVPNLPANIGTIQAMIKRCYKSFMSEPCSLKKWSRHNIKHCSISIINNKSR